MNVWRLVLREISHRKLNFLLALLSVTVAVGCFVGSLTLLEAHEISTKNILDQKTEEIETSVAKRQEDVKAAGDALSNTMRKIQLGLGFNIFVLPKGEDLENFNVNGALTETMPEAYVEKLANSKIVTVNHLLPMVTKRLDWQGPAQKQTIIVIGTRGEVGQTTGLVVGIPSAPGRRSQQERSVKINGGGCDPRVGHTLAPQVSAAVEIETMELAKHVAYERMSLPHRQAAGKTQSCGADLTVDDLA